MTKTDELREQIHLIGADIATLAVREYVGEAENYIEEFHQFITQILKACVKAGLVFEDKDAVVENPHESMKYSTYHAKPVSELENIGKLRLSRLTTIEESTHARNAWCAGARWGAFKDGVDAQRKFETEEIEL